MRNIECLLVIAWFVLMGSAAAAEGPPRVRRPVALAAARLISGQLYGLKPADPSTIAGAIFLIAAVGALAGYIPARRATRVDPIVALRHE